MTYYLYEIRFETGHVYYGMRRCECDPEDDTGYTGSPVTHKDFWKNYKFKKKILKVYPEEEFETCVEDERFLINWQWHSTDEGKNFSLNAAVCHKYLHLKEPPSIKTYFIIGPDLVFYEGTNIRKFCREHNLSYQNMCTVIYGRARHCQGYTTTIRNHLEWKFYNNSKYQDPVKVYHPKHGFHTVYHRQDFATKFDLDSSSLVAMINGRYKSCKGWILAKNKPEEKFYNFFNSELGQSFSTTMKNFKFFCDLYDLSRSKLKMVIKKERSHHKNWRLLSST